MNYKATSLILGTFVLILLIMSYCLYQNRSFLKITKKPVESNIIETYCQPYYVSPDFLMGRKYGRVNIPIQRMIYC